MRKLLAAVTLACLLFGCTSAGVRSHTAETDWPDGTHTKSTDRALSYVDWSSTTSIIGALAENVDWKAALKGPLGIALGGAGAGVITFGTWFLSLLKHKHQSIGRAQVRSAKAEK